MNSRRKINTFSSSIMERLEKRQLKNWLMAMLTLRESIMVLIKMKGCSNRMKNCYRGLLKQHPLKLSFNQENSIKMHLKCRAAMIKPQQLSSKSLTFLQTTRWMSNLKWQKIKANQLWALLLMLSNHPLDWEGRPLKLLSCWHCKSKLRKYHMKSGLGKRIMRLNLDLNWSLKLKEIC